MTLFEIRDVVVTARHKDVLLRFVRLMVHSQEGHDGHIAHLLCNFTVLSTVCEQDVTSSYLFIYHTPVYTIAITPQYIFRTIIKAGVRHAPGSILFAQCGLVYF